MTERLPESALTQQLAVLAALHVQMAEVYARIAELSNQRGFLLRRDMQHNYGEATREAQRLFDQAQHDITDLRAQIGAQQLPPEVAETIAAIESDIVHIKHMLAGEPSDAEGAGDAERP